MNFKRYITAALLSCAALSAWALDSPVGVWRTIDDKTGKEKSLVRISEVNGELRGTIEKLFREPGEEPNPNCDKCPGEKKNKPVIGMTILTGLKRDGQEYAGGEILDPANGKTYKCKMWTTDGGKRLNVRGFIGVSVLGRTQVWVREE
ncbi:MAG: DUF2147 domain-containing protein [Burkholderiaceae bacterium]|nr:DUF2147 domain-containing protein [Burkholderiaceae bacterium]